MTIAALSYLPLNFNQHIRIPCNRRAESVKAFPSEYAITINTLHHGTDATLPGVLESPGADIVLRRLAAPFIRNGVTV